MYFVQKLSLDASKSYVTSTTIDNLLENLELSFKRIPIITPYASKSEDISNMDNDSKKSFRITLPIYLQNAESFDCSHVVVEDYDLMEDFGYKVEDIKKPIISTSNKSNANVLHLCSFFIKAEKNERFMVLYILSRFFKITVFSKEEEKARIFCRVFDIDCDIMSYEDEVSDAECCIFLDGYKKVDSERVFVIGTKSYGLDKLTIDINSIGKYKYRINDVMQAISPSVIKHKRQFDYNRFININKD
jgi:hypothetical protein